MNYLRNELYELVKDNEDIFDFLQDGSLDGVWYWDLIEPDNEWMSDRFWEVFGVDPTTKDHKASEWQDIIYQDDLKTALENFNKHLENPSHPYDQIVRYKHSDGSTVWVRCRGIAIRDESGKPIRMLGAHQDVTKLKQSELQLQESESRYRELLKSLDSGIIIYNSDHIIVEFNDKAVDLIGISKEQALGSKAKDLKINLIDRNETPLLLENYPIHLILNSGERLKDYIIGIKRPKGVTWVNVNGFIRVSEQGDLNEVVLSFGDITKRMNSRLSLEYAASHDYLTNLYNRSYYEKYLRKLDKEGVYPICLAIADINGLKLVNDAFGHNSGDDMLVQTANILNEVVGSKGLVARIGGDEFAIVFNSCNQSELLSIFKDIEEKCSKVTIQSIPLSLSIGYSCKNMKNQSLFEISKSAEDKMYREKLAEVPTMRNDAIKTIMSTLNIKDTYSELHSIRVSKFAARFAEVLSFDREDITKIETAGMLHDIGKIIMPSSILLSSDKLTKEEWDTMKTHPEIGFRILHSSSEFRELSTIVLEHHERFDGTGYPMGKKGKDICLEARLICIVDAFEAMTSDRYYRNKVSFKEALEEIKRCSGKQFDPMLVDAFVSNFNFIIEGVK